MAAITNAQFASLMKHGCCLGGSRPKLTCLHDDGRPALVKPPRAGDTHSVPSAEVLALHMARHAGITAAQAKTWTIAQTTVAVITRFDGTPQRERRHDISAARQLLGIPAQRDRWFRRERDRLPG